MPFIGTTPTQGFVSSFPKQSFTPNGSTTVFTLTNPVATANDLEVFVGNVRQEPTTAYTAAGTTLTMSEAPASNLNFYVINKSFAQVTTTPPVNSISTDKIQNNAVTAAKIPNSAITDAKIGGMAASKLTGAMPALDGSALTGTGKVGIVSYSHTGGSAVSTIDIDLPTDTKYRYFKLIFSDWYGSTGADFYARFRWNGQSSVDTGNNYHWMLTASHHGTATVSRRSSNGDSKCRLNWYGHGNSTLETSTIEIDIFESNSTSETFCMHRRWGTDSNNDVTMDVGGFRHYYNIVTDRIQLYASSGTITYSAYTLYGIERE